jgi:putative ABC transport system substrate-binding protein
MRQQARANGRKAYTRDLFCFVICTFVLAFSLCPSVDAQQSKKIPPIGYLTVGSPESTPARYEAFGQGLREVGYTKGKDIIVEYRYA